MIRHNTSATDPEFDAPGHKTGTHFGQFVRLRRRKSAFPWTRLLVAGALLTVGALGCGGGGSSGGPTFPTTPATECGLDTYSPNFAREANLYFWPQFPLRIAFIQDGMFNQERANLALSGFNTWVAATNNSVAYVLVSDPSQANVTVQFVNPNGDQVGLTRVTHIQGVLQSAEVSIGITGNNDEDFNTAAHEFGHALGILGHSAVSTDLMYSFGNTSGCNCITQRDLNTLLTAYCGDFARKVLPRDGTPSGKVEEEVIVCSLSDKHSH